MQVYPRGQHYLILWQSLVQQMEHGAQGTACKGLERSKKVFVVEICNTKEVPLGRYLRLARDESGEVV